MTARRAVQARPVACKVNADHGGTHAVVWAAAGRGAELDGQAQRDLTLGHADDAAGHLEALDRIAERRRAGRLDG